MKLYIVGGYVRDTLLGKPHKDKDYVIVGAMQADLISAGYKLVGEDFPVFIHPTTGDQYTLIEGGDTSSALIGDLARRDITINAMALNNNSGELIDPFNGKQDLANGIIRHMPLFANDPLRILRVARFAARYDFSVAKETTELMQVMAASGILQTLAKDRIWTELEKILSENNSLKACKLLDSVGVITQIFKYASLTFPENEKAFNELSISNKFIALTWAFDYSDSDFSDMRVPVKVQRAYRLYLRVRKNYDTFDSLDSSAKVNFLMAIGAFNDMSVFADICPLLNMACPKAMVMTLGLAIAAAKTVDCEYISKNNANNIASAIFNARVNAININLCVIGEGNA